MKIIGLSFKNNKEDIELYEWIILHSNKSGFIKDILRSVKNSENDSPKKEIKNCKNNNVASKTELLDIGDF